MITIAGAVVIINAIRQFRCQFRYYWRITPERKSLNLVCLKLVTTILLASIVTEPCAQSPSPLQPVKVEPVFDTACSVTASEGFAWNQVLQSHCLYASNYPLICHI